MRVTTYDLLRNKLTIELSMHFIMEAMVGAIVSRWLVHCHEVKHIWQSQCLLFTQELALLSSQLCVRQRALQLLLTSIMAMD